MKCSAKNKQANLARFLPWELFASIETPRRRLTANSFEPSWSA